MFRPYCLMSDSTHYYDTIVKLLYDRSVERYRTKESCLPAKIKAMAYLNTHVSKVSAVSETLRLILKTTGRHISKEDNIKINGNTAIYVVFTDAVTSIMLINMIKEEPHLATIVPSLSNTTLLL